MTNPLFGNGTSEFAHLQSELIKVIQSINLLMENIPANDLAIILKIIASGEKEDLVLESANEIFKSDLILYVKQVLESTTKLCQKVTESIQGVKTSKGKTLAIAADDISEAIFSLLPESFAASKSLENLTNLHKIISEAGIIDSDGFAATAILSGLTLFQQKHKLEPGDLRDILEQLQHIQQIGKNSISIDLHTNPQFQFYLKQKNSKLIKKIYQMFDDVIHAFGSNDLIQIKLAIKNFRKQLKADSDFQKLTEEEKLILKNNLQRLIDYQNFIHQANICAQGEKTRLEAFLAQMRLLQLGSLVDDLSYELEIEIKEIVNSHFSSASTDLEKSKTTASNLGLSIQYLCHLKEIENSSGIYKDYLKAILEEKHEADPNDPQIDVIKNKITAVEQILDKTGKAKQAIKDCVKSGYEQPKIDAVDRTIKECFDSVDQHKSTFIQNDPQEKGLNYVRSIATTAAKCFVSVVAAPFALAAGIVTVVTFTGFLENNLANAFRNLYSMMWDKAPPTQDERFFTQTSKSFASRCFAKFSFNKEKQTASDKEKSASHDTRRPRF